MLIRLIRNEVLNCKSCLNESTLHAKHANCKELLNKKLEFLHIIFLIYSEILLRVLLILTYIKL
jgi:hypothetical protein